MKRRQVIGLVVICVMILLWCIVGTLSGDDYTGISANGEYISIIGIYGEIGDISYDIYGNETSLSCYSITEYLDVIAEDENNMGVFLAIDSPGGSVYDSDKIYMGLMEYKEKTGRPIVAACGSCMCSGAYYIAAAADEIYAERTADVGSIGVYIQTIDVSELCGKLGLKVNYIRSSDNKAMGNYFNAMTEEQVAILQSDVNEHYERFLDIVQESRGYDRDTLRKIADGRSYSATKALDNGLIDGIMEMEDALNQFMEELGVIYTDYPYVASEDVLSSIINGVISAMPQDELALLEMAEKNNGKAMYYAG